MWDISFKLYFPSECSVMILIWIKYHPAYQKCNNTCWIINWLKNFTYVRIRSSLFKSFWTSFSLRNPDLKSYCIVFPSFSETFHSQRNTSRISVPNLDGGFRSFTFNELESRFLPRSAVTVHRSEGSITNRGW